MKKFENFNDAIHDCAEDIMMFMLEEDPGVGFDALRLVDEIKGTLVSLDNLVEHHKKIDVVPAPTEVERYWELLAAYGLQGLSDFLGKSKSDLAHEVAELVISKQHDYGPKNIMDSPPGVEIGLVVRMFDKAARLRNLLENKKDPKNESIEDTWRDVVGYSLIGMMVVRSVFEKPLLTA